MNDEIKADLREIRKRFVKFVTNRLFIVFALIAVMFYGVIGRLYAIQIIGGADYVKAEPQLIKKSHAQPVAAARGEIFDRYGRPLAVNEIAFTVKIDPAVKSKLPAQTVAAFARMMDLHGDEIIEQAKDFPISKTTPRVFMLNDDEEQEVHWKKNEMDVPPEYDAQQSFDYLAEFFGVDESAPDDLKWRILSLCSSVYMQRYKLTQLTVAVNVSDATVAVLEERNQDFPGFYVDVDYLRRYPAGENFSHVLGYIRAISQTEFESLKDYGYRDTSIVGKTGVEKAFDLALKGEDGEKIIETDYAGRQVSSVKTVDPVPGADITLTIDARLQDEAARLLKDMLKTILANKMRGAGAPKEPPITPYDLLASMVTSGSVSADMIMNSEDGTWSGRIKSFVAERFDTEPTNKNYDYRLKQFMAESVKAKTIPAGYFALAMAEQGIIGLSSGQSESLSKSDRDLASILLEKVETGEITPQMANMIPVDGSVVVVEVGSGDVLCAVSYPSYDNNEFVNNFNNEYYRKLASDPTSPMWYRAFSDPRAPGSTFKMITALAALQEGVINKDTRVVDRGTFTEAGEPYANCWIHTPGFHGSVNVTRALEVSCNYFFYDTMYKMGSTKAGTKLEGIGALNRYMEYFGLNERSGVEISELYDSMPDDVMKISSPEFKSYKEKSRDPNLTDADVDWKDGDSIRTAIGQSLNNYTAAGMAKYISTLASGGRRYQLHLLNGQKSADGTKEEFAPNLEEAVPLDSGNLEAVYEGMFNVAQGQNGTARKVFDGFPLKIGAKTGTAEEEGFPHATFAAFAPYENPQIAVYVVIPNGDTLTVSAPAAQIGRDVIAAYFGLDQKPVAAPKENALAR